MEKEKKEKKRKKIKLRKKTNIILNGINAVLYAMDKHIMQIRDIKENLTPKLDIKEFSFKRNDDGNFEVKFDITDCGNGTIKGDFWTCLHMIEAWRNWGEK